VTTPPLTIEMIPRPLHRKGLSNLLKRKLWDVIGRSVRARAQGRCEICDKESKRLDCHEVWSYDDERRVARLVGLKAICSACHLSTHLGRAMSIGRQEQAFDHLMEVNGWTWHEARPYVAHAMEEYVMRSKNAWVLDVSELPNIVQSLEAEEGIASFAARPAVKFMEDKLGPYHPSGSNAVRSETPMARLRSVFAGAQECALVDRV
jgi:hypothetical protein